MIGVKRGASYFEPFDHDDALNKMVVNDEEQLAQLLIHKRIDTFIGSAIIFDHVIKQIDSSVKLVRANYQPGPGNFSYLTVSKKSPLSANKALIEQALKKLLENGVYQQTLEHYLTSE
ncbi:hypothetical protein [Thalassotalea ganghwensis]